MKGYFSLLLHTHMPYVRKNGIWPVGEDWLYQVMSGTYLPLINALERLNDEGVFPCAALTLTPVLCEQLADPYIQERFIAHLKTMAEHTTRDIRDFEYFQDPGRKALAQSYCEEFRSKLLAFTSIGGDLLGALASLEREGAIETIASSATHAFLPAQEDERSVKRQVLLGLESHRKHLGRNPAGFWIPECAYREGIERLLEAEGVRYIVADATSTPELPSTCAYMVGESRVAALMISERARRNVWDDVSGYPTDGTYMDTTKYYDGSGLHYWKVTGPKVPIEEKEVYAPDPATRRVLDHSRHFVQDVAGEIDSAEPCVGDAKPLVLAAYDTELFGHGWHEGVYWMEVTLRSLSGSDSIQVTVPSRYLDDNPPMSSTRLAESSWGTGRDHSTWVNPETGWMWRELTKAQERLFDLASRFSGESDRSASRALTQATREVLLLESSDWPYMVAKERAKKYATERFNTHLERFRGISDALESGEPGRTITLLSEVEEADNIFAELDLGVISGQ